MRKILILFCVLLMALPLPAYAVEGVQEIADGILAASCGGNDLQAWLDGDLVMGAGSGSDAYVLALRKTGTELNYENYLETIAILLSDDCISSPVSAQRCALILLICDAKEMIPGGFADKTIGKLGVMSYVYGLHLLRNGLESELWTEESVLDKLLSMQLTDGGWAVRGMFSDPDVTSMAVQVLGLYCEKNENVQSAIDRAVEYLSGAQKESGGYSSYGNENSESAAQVISALYTLGIDPGTDARFIKNGNSVWDALMEYRLEDGSFAHFLDGESNAMASVQALQALISALQLDVPYFDFSNLPPMPQNDTVSGGIGWKLYALAAIGVFFVLGTVFALTRRCGKIKNLLLVSIVSAIAVVAVICINFQSVTDYYGSEVKTSDAETGEVYITIRCDLVAGRDDPKITPEDGIILPRTAVAVHEGDSVFDVLVSAVRKNKIHMEYAGTGESFAYLNGINNLYEYAYGDLSGWVYNVNGEFHSIGCGSYIVSDGDEIEWHYTLSLGEDLK